GSRSRKPVPGICRSRSWKPGLSLEGPGGLLVHSPQCVPGCFVPRSREPPTHIWNLGEIWLSWPLWDAKRLPRGQPPHAPVISIRDGIDNSIRLTIGVSFDDR